MRILERGRHPVPEAAFKIGESSVEIGAHYLETVLGLKPHLDQCQLCKFGFRFFFNEGRDDLDQCTELGVSEVFPTPSYQLDRGILENYLAEHAATLGAEFLDGAIVRQIDLDEGPYGDQAGALRAQRRRTPRAGTLADRCKRPDRPA